MKDKILFNSVYEKRLVIIAAVFLLILSGPYFCWWITKNIMLKWLVTLALCFVFYKQRERLSKASLSIIILYVFTFLYGLLNTLFKGRMTFFGIVDVIPNAFLVYVLCANLDFSRKVYHYFILLFSLLMAASIIAQLLYMLDILPSLGTIVNPDQDRIYTVYPFLIREQVSDVYNLSGMRFSGAYDEPGAIGTLAAILLCIDGFRLKSFKNIVFLITGLMSMSLAFYIILVVFSLLHALIVRKNILLVMSIVICIGFFYKYTIDNPFFDTLIWERLEWDEDKQGIAGEDRMVGDADYYFDKHVKGTSAYWFGLKDTKDFWKAAEGSSSYKVVIAQNGMIFLMLYLLSFIVLAIRHKSQKVGVLIFLILLLANTMQRPNIYAPIWVFLYSYYARLDTSSKKSM